MAEQAIPSVGVFTEQNRAAIAANFTELYAGSGGGSLTHQATVVLTDAQIKTLPTDRVLVVEAAGADRVIVPLSAWVVLDTLAGAYVLVGGVESSLNLVWGPTNSKYASAILTTNAALTGTPAIVPGQFVFPFVSNPGAGSFAGEVVTELGAGMLLAEITDVELYVKDDYLGASNYTEGDPANTLRISVAYALLNVSTGLFE